MEAPPPIFQLNELSSDALAHLELANDFYEALCEIKDQVTSENLFLLNEFFNPTLLSRALAHLKLASGFHEAL